MNYILKNTNKKNFTTISNDFLNSSISNLAKLLGTLLLSKPSDWIINPRQIKKELNIGMDKTNVLIKELIESGYMVKMKKSITFAKSGEMKNIFYFSDNREVLMGAFKNTAPDFPPMEKTTDTNKEDYKKDIIQKEDTKLTIFSNLEETLDNLLDSGTKRNLLKLKPNITLEEFNELYKNVSEQYKLGFTTNLNACLILAASGKWKFRSKTISKTKSKEVINPEKILAGKVDYFYSYYIETRCNPEEILLKFQNDSKKYDSSLVQNFYELLDVKLKKGY